MVSAHRQVLAGLVLVGALASGCASSQIGGTPTPRDTPHLVPGTLQASFVPIDQVSTMVGVTLSSSAGTDRPAPALTADPASCTIAVGPATGTVFTTGWTVFGSVTYQDSDQTADHTVTQVLGRYPDPTSAGTVFSALTSGVQGCPSATRTDADNNTSRWAYKIDSATADTLIWTATQDAGGGWACYRQARLKGAAVIEVAVCEGGNGKPAAATIADHFAANVTG